MLNEIQFGHHMTRAGLHQVSARHGENFVGGLQWNHEDDPDAGAYEGKIAAVAVLPEYQGRGIASGMLKHAKSLADENPDDIPYPEHSSSRSPAGSAWAAKNSGRVPQNKEPQPPFDENRTRSLVNSMRNA